MMGLVWCMTSTMFSFEFGMLGSERRYLRVVNLSEDLQENPMDPGCLDGKHQLLWFEITFLVHTSNYIDLLHSNLWNWTFSIRECVGQNPWQKSVVMTSLVELWMLCPQNQLFLSVFSACWIFAGFSNHNTTKHVLLTLMWKSLSKSPFKQNKYPMVFCLFSWCFLTGSTTVNHQQTIWGRYIFQPPFANRSG